MCIERLLSAAFGRFDMTKRLAFAILGVLLLASISRADTWTRKLTQSEILVARGSKLADYSYFRKDTRNGRERPIRELDRWFRFWNHHGIAYSPDGRWAVWRDADGLLVMASIDGRMQRSVWADYGDEHNPLLWLPDSRRFVEVEDYRSGDSRSHRIEILDRLRPRKRVYRELTRELAERLSAVSESGKIPVGLANQILRR